MTQQTTNTTARDDDAGGRGKGPNYVLDLEGVDYPWPEPTITVAQIREVAGWTGDQQVMIVDLRTNEETVLSHDQPIELKPGHGFGRKFKFRRGAA